MQIPPNDRSEHVLPVNNIGADGAKADTERAAINAATIRKEFDDFILHNPSYFPSELICSDISLLKMNAVYTVNYVVSYYET